jgi:hypothetical protein
MILIMGHRGKAKKGKDLQSVKTYNQHGKYRSFIPNDDPGVPVNRQY